MRVDAFDFKLPPELIALRPARPRDAAKLLYAGVDGLQVRTMAHLPALLRPGDVLVFNRSRVVPAALVALRPGRGPDAPPVHATLNLHARIDAARWKAFAKPGRRLRVGDRLEFSGGLAALIEAKNGGELTLAFTRSGAELDAAVEAIGAPPLPPYIAERRPADAADVADYQTIYAAEKGSVAAPTAGLHFTQALFEALDAAGVERREIVLHVGAGTFLPVKSDDTEGHVMHAEHFVIDAETADALNKARQEGRRIVAVGTTALRALESAAGPDGAIKAGAADTAIFITPGYRFRAVDGLVTNFHLPRSTLFMLVCAFAGLEPMHAAYAFAIQNHLRFYSYGDASLLWRADG